MTEVLEKPKNYSGVPLFPDKIKTLDFPKSLILFQDKEEFYSANQFIDFEMRGNREDEKEVKVLFAVKNLRPSNVPSKYKEVHYTIEEATRIALELECYVILILDEDNVNMKYQFV